MKYSQFLIFFILIFFVTLTSCKDFGNSQPSKERDEVTKMKDWPCPIAEEITPCTCSLHNDDPSLLFLSCENASLVDIERVFSIDFPFNTFYIMRWHNQDSQVIEELPMDVFQDKSFELIYLEIPKSDNL